MPALNNSVGFKKDAYFWVVLALLAVFPLVLRSSGALDIYRGSFDTAGYSSALLRFCLIVTLYLWCLYFVVWWRVGSKDSGGMERLVGMAEAKRAGLSKIATTTVQTFLALLVVGGASNALFLRFLGSNQPAQALNVRGILEALAFLVVALTAGFVEEVVFRGYLQQQIYARSGSMVLASVLQVAIFTLGHTYQGWLRLVPVALEGAILTIVALRRKSLVPGMIAHGVGDSLMSLSYLLGVLTR